jgi:anti-sigma factor (TIGR02949 family)
MKVLKFGNNACERTRRCLDSYLANEMLAETRRGIERHLETCPACSAELAARTSLRGRLKAAVQRQEVPPGLDARLREALRHTKSRPRPPIAWMPWAAAAAVLFLAVATWLIRPLGAPALPDLADRRGQDVFIRKVSHDLAAVLQVGLGDHIHCSIFRKYPKDPPTIDEMAAMLGPSYKELVPIVKDHVPGGFRILLAHQCGYLGRRFVHVTLSDGSNLLSLVITRKQPAESLASLKPTFQASGVAVYQSVARDYDVASFESGQYLAYVISDLGRKRNLEIARNLAPRVHDFLAAIQG